MVNPEANFIETVRSDAPTINRLPPRSVKFIRKFAEDNSVPINLQANLADWLQSQLDDGLLIKLHSRISSEFIADYYKRLGILGEINLVSRGSVTLATNVREGCHPLFEDYFDRHTTPIAHEIHFVPFGKIHASTDRKERVGAVLLGVHDIEGILDYLVAHRQEKNFSHVLCGVTNYEMMLIAKSLGFKNTPYRKYKRRVMQYLPIIKEFSSLYIDCFQLITTIDDLDGHREFIKGQQVRAESLASNMGITGRSLRIHAVTSSIYRTKFEF